MLTLMGVRLCVAIPLPTESAAQGGPWGCPSQCTEPCTCSLVAASRRFIPYPWCQ